MAAADAADAEDSSAAPPGVRPATPDSPTLQIPVRVELPPEPAPPGSPLPTRPPRAALAAPAAGPAAGAALGDGAPRGFGRYIVEAEIGRGGMGVVYRAFDRDLRRRVAMKVLSGALGRDRDLVERFAEEAQATAQLQHPGIVPVHDIGVDDRDRLYFTMKLVRGRTLARIVEQALAGDAPTVAEFTLFRRLQIFADVARTIAYAHARGVVHRDLKPQNVMVGAFGEVLVLDWGLAKVLGTAGGERPRAGAEPASGIATAGARAETQAGALVGTPAYMAPEQAQGELRRVGPLADVYALGATLYHVLAGRPPFDGASSAEVVARVLTVDSPRPRAIDRTVPREVEAICLRAMAKAPGDRYPSAQTLADDVQAFLEGRPVAACPDGLLGRAAKWARRHRTFTTTAAVALIVGLAGAVAALVVIDGQRRAAVAARGGEARARRAAEDARRAAETNRERAEDLVAFMLFEVVEDLGPERRDVLESLARRARTYYETAPPEALTPPARRRHAFALVTLGVVQEGRGESDEALASYRASLRILERLDVETGAPREVFADLGYAELGIGRVLQTRGERGEALASYRRAVAALERLVAREPRRPTFRRRLVEAHVDVAQSLQLEGRLEEALESLRAALALAEALVAGAAAPGGEVGLLGVCRARLASIQADLGRDGEALESYRRAIAIFDDGPAFKASAPRLQQELARMADQAALFLAGRGETDEALALETRAIDALERLRARDPGSARSFTTSRARG